VESSGSAQGLISDRKGRLVSREFAFCFLESLLAPGKKARDLPGREGGNKPFKKAILLMTIHTAAALLLAANLLSYAAWDLPPLDRPVVRAISMTLPSVVAVRTRKAGGFLGLGKAEPSGQGTGIIISQEGYILTCEHLVRHSDQKYPPLILVGPREEVPAEIIAADPECDLALLWARLPKRAPPFRCDRLSPNVLGQTVLIIGGSLGLRQSVSRGVLSSHVQEVSLSGGRSFYFLQLDAAVNPGNSGAPVVDLEGRLVGVCLAKLGGQAVEHVGLAIPGSFVRRWIAQVLHQRRKLSEGSPLPTGKSSPKLEPASFSPGKLPLEFLPSATGKGG
jgi:S1-C subfamily serine protease